MGSGGFHIYNFPRLLDTYTYTSTSKYNILPSKIVCFTSTFYRKITSVPLQLPHLDPFPYTEAPRSAVALMIIMGTPEAR